MVDLERMERALKDFCEVLIEEGIKSSHFEVALKKFCQTYISEIAEKEYEEAYNKTAEAIAFREMLARKQAENEANREIYKKIEPIVEEAKTQERKKLHSEIEEVFSKWSW